MSRAPCPPPPPTGRRPRRPGPLLPARPLARSYNNIGVFRGVVKMRRGQTAGLMVSLRTMGDVYAGFRSFTHDIMGKCQGLAAARGGPEMGETARLCEGILERCDRGLRAFYQEGGAPAADDEVPFWVRFGLLFLFGGYFGYAWQVGGVRAALGVAGLPVSSAYDLSNKALATVLLLFFGHVAVTGRRIGTDASGN